MLYWILSVLLFLIELIMNNLNVTWIIRMIFLFAIIIRLSTKIFQISNTWFFIEIFYIFVWSRTCVIYIIIRILVLFCFLGAIWEFLIEYVLVTKLFNEEECAISKRALSPPDTANKVQMNNHLWYPNWNSVWK